MASCSVPSSPPPPRLRSLRRPNSLPDARFPVLSRRRNFSCLRVEQFASRSANFRVAVVTASEVSGREERRGDGFGFGGADDFEEELQGLFDEVKGMIADGKAEDARSLLQANLEAVKMQLKEGLGGIREAALLDVLGLGYMALGELKVVATILDLMEEILGNLKGGDRLVDSILMHMGSMYSKLGKYDKSLRMYERAVGILANTYGENAFLVSPLLGMANALGSTGRTTKAVEVYNRAIAILEQDRGVESEELVVPLSGLGNLWVKEGKADLAENAFNRILSIYKKLYGENDGRVGLALSSLAQAKCAKGDINEAIQLYEDAIQVLKDSKFVALDDGLMEKLRTDLAELLHVAGRYSEGREQLEENLLINEKFKGKGHPSSVPHFVNLASSYSRAKNFVEAERLLRTGLNILTAKVGPEDPYISFPMLNLSVVLYHLERDLEAEKLATEALHIRERAFGKDSVPVGEALDCLISIETRLGEGDEKLLELLKRVLVIQEKHMGHESEEVLLTLKKLVFYLDRLGRKDEKTRLQRRLSMLKAKYKQMIRY
ncbi:hypothetical protein MLD38_029204 [Melastoma candidum]|uniref:Uncharacterized protein n=1 Tax=Melastoma candidum TaxID=119954 RepID=A0ACB9N3E8_9MYRT|nr:hypothetical protein MLD38_029204 [Melastoma candidum]